MDHDERLEVKFCAGQAPVQVADGLRLEGYASLFGQPDQGGDCVQPGAFARALARLKARGGSVKMLWQHDPAEPIGVWEEIVEDARGLYVKGRLLPEVARAREAAALIGAGAIDGLSIGYRTIAAERDGKGQRLLSELELWEVSLVTFPMLREARVAAKSGGPEAEAWRALAAVLRNASAEMAARVAPA
ncbi:HK97 family phage prohead protease [Rhodobacter maris]|uniref:Prohead peptidase n=1 Tax=Rhodobacter maris TaxID=446682 RepID=A0A285SNE4_9RHOB|nr:HK97 family phage prohead protease [Rhodobacter maris]SOC07663.1 prohead peptidase [Rhodobacter maris]